MKKNLRSLLAGGALGLVMAAVGIAHAQTSVSVDINKAKLAWTWAQGTGGPADGFNVKCGTASKTYSKTTVVGPAVRDIAVNSAITGLGTWFCVVTAFNGTGTSMLESGPTNEVSFLAGAIPVNPTSLTIQAN